MRSNFQKFLPERDQSPNRIFIALIAIMLLVLSCTITGEADNGLQQTQAALNVQMTVLAQQSGQNQQATDAAVAITRVASEVQSTVLAQQATQLAQQATDLAGQPQEIETQPPPVQETQPPSIATEAPPEVDIEDKIKNAKILLFEDMAGTGWYELWEDALKMGSYTFKDDGSAQGWFKDDLLSTNKWDLIIAASESRVKIQGEYFVYLQDHINRGTGVIIEHWDLDDLSRGKVAPILSKCGVAIYRDWFVPLNAVPDLSVWALHPDHPVFNDPYSGISLRNYANFWNLDTDRGDLLKLGAGGDATLLAGTIATNKSDHGTLAECMDGRLLLQTFSSHEYRTESILSLMNNMIYYTLKNHFLYQQQNP